MLFNPLTLPGPQWATKLGRATHAPLHCVPAARFVKPQKHPASSLDKIKAHPTLCFAQATILRGLQFNNSGLQLSEP